MEKYAVIVAGGSGTRMGTDIPKQFQLLKGKPVLWHTIHAFTEAYADIKIILVLPTDYLERGQAICKEFLSTQIHIATGGETRFHSVKNGLKLVTEKSIVFVHDGVRCLITPSLIHRCYETALDKGNAIPATSATDSLRIETTDGNEPVDRSKVRVIQTPQTFLSEVIKAAFDTEYLEAFTDEASVVEKKGIKIYLVEGENTNIKITRPVDMLIAEKILEERSSF